LRVVGSGFLRVEGFGRTVASSTRVDIYIEREGDIYIYIYIYIYRKRERQREREGEREREVGREGDRERGRVDRGLLRPHCVRPRRSAGHLDRDLNEYTSGLASCIPSAETV